MNVPRLSILFLALACAQVNAQTSQPSTAPSAASPTDFATALRDAKPGDIVRTSFADLAATPAALPITVQPSAGAATLVFSDRPEYFRAGDGIGSQDTVQPGRIRFYDYHVPVLKDGKPRRELTVIENLGDKEATLTFAARSEPAPSGDYNAVAKEGLLDLYNGKGAGTIVKIAPRGHTLSSGVEPISTPDLLVHRLYDFTTDQPLRITVAQITATPDLNADVAAIASLPKLPMLPYGVAVDKSGRGVFPAVDLDVTAADGATYDTSAGATKIVLANGKTDPWREGIDGISGDKTTNKGNYGVVYHVHLKWKSSDGRGVALLFSASHYEREKCGLVGTAARVNDGRNPGGVIPLPRDDVRYHGLPEACVVQTYDAPAKGDEGTIDFLYSPPGACCIPIPILLVPIDP